jgi:hypothetical protein
MELQSQAYVDAALLLAVLAGDVANFCDHAEHNEPADVEHVRRAGDELRLLSVELSATSGRDAIELYADRIAQIEARNVLGHEEALDGADLARAAGTWRDLQLVQAAHDKSYHADVVGLSKAEQLRHYALHVAKLAGATAALARGAGDPTDWLVRRVPDMLLFGLKLATVTGLKLSDEPLPHAHVTAGAISAN